MAVSDSETDPGYRSRSASRRARRKKQTQKQNMSSLPEEGQSAEANSQASSGQSAEAQSSAQEQSSAQAQRSQDPQQAQQQPGAMQPFEYIGPDSTSMDGPVTYARATRGEIPMRPYVFALHRVPPSPFLSVRVFADMETVGEIRTRR